MPSGPERRRYALIALPPAPSGRPRRDPRARRMAAIGWAPLRPRIDWYAGVVAAAGIAERGPRATPAPAIRIIAEPAFLVLAVVDQPGGTLSEHDLQLIGAARQFADTGGGAVVALAIGTIDGLAAGGADRAMALPADLSGNDHPDFRAAAIAATMGKLKPRHVLFAETPEGGADLARRIAAVSGERLFSGVENMEGGRVSRQARGGKAEMLAEAPRLMSIAENAFAPHDGPPHEAREIAAPAFSVRRRSTDRVTRLAADPEAISLAEADFILSGGNGVTDWDAFAELGRVLGATRGGSRVVCDEGHLPRDRQVGASGSLVTARCYLAFGISGAPQHLQGITEVKHVVAINTDLHAEMIKRADLAIIADAQEVMPALIRHARARSGKAGIELPSDRGTRHEPGADPTAAAGSFHQERSSSSAPAHSLRSRANALALRFASIFSSSRGRRDG
jgi:electron transfer flavoprotein alpha subunit